MEICGDNRFEIIAKAKEHLLDATNIDTSEDEMKVLDSFLFRCWQMGWLDRYESKEDGEDYLRGYQDGWNAHDTITRALYIDKPRGYTLKADSVSAYKKPKDEPQTEYERGKRDAWKTAQTVFGSTVTLYEAEDVAKQITKPQTDCPDCKYDDGREWYEEPCGSCWLGNKREPKDKPQTDCPQSNICAKPCKECGACEEECGMWKALNEQQTDCAWK